MQRCRSEPVVCIQGSGELPQLPPRRHNKRCMHHVIVLRPTVYDFDGVLGARNSLRSLPQFSILAGLAHIYLGIASYLFHGTHSETWRKADAGMTNGASVTMLCFSFYDRACAAGMTASATAGAMTTAATAATATSGCGGEVWAQHFNSDVSTS